MQGDALTYTAAQLVQEMEQTLYEAVEAGAPEDEIADLGVTALTLTHSILAARKKQARTIEEEIAEMRGRSTNFAKLLSEDRARSAG